MADHRSAFGFLLHKLSVLFFGSLAFVAFFASIVQTGRFVHFVSRHENVSNLAPSESSHVEVKDEKWILKLVMNLMLILVFVIQHSVMALTRWKKFLKFFGLEVVERVIYIIATCYSLEVMMRFWQSTMSVNLWTFDLTDRPLLWCAFTVLHALLWVLILGATLMMDMYELIGLKQVYYHSQNMMIPLQLKSDGLQRFCSGMRHPGSTSLCLLLWIHPHMTASRLLLTVLLSIYMWVRFTVDHQDYLYLKNNLAKKQDELNHLMSENRRVERQTICSSWSTRYH